MLVIAPALRVPYPIVLVIGGVALGFVPGMPELELPPDLVLVAVLPPLLYAGTFFTSLHELKLNMRPIGLLAVGLVIVTMLAVALVAHAAVASQLEHGLRARARSSPPLIPVAATAIARRFGVPRRLVAIVEGESLINDGTALVAYRFAVVAVVSGAFSIWKAGLEFVYAVTAGVAIGLAVGWLVRQLRRRLDNPPLEITIALLSAYLAAIPAELIHASAVLAAVTVGVYMGAHTSELTTAQTRVQGDAVWEIIVFMLNALLFVLIGLQLPVIVDELSGGEPAGTLLLYGLVVSATVILVRIGWTFAVTYAPRLLSRRIRERDPLPPWQHPAFVSWAGMRGAVSLAAALALPLTIDDGAPFPDRDLILLLAFSVVAATLVGQGLTMPLVIRFLGLESDRHLERGGSAGPRPRRRGSPRQAGGARRRRLGAVRDCRAPARPLRVPARSIHRAVHPGGGGRPRRAAARLPASAPRADRGRARGARRATPRRRDHRARRTAGGTRPRSRGSAARPVAGKVLRPWRP